MLPRVLFCTVSSLTTLSKGRGELPSPGSAGRQQEDAHPWHSHSSAPWIRCLTQNSLISFLSSPCTGRTWSISDKGLWMFPEAVVGALGLHPSACLICSQPLSSPHQPKANLSMEKDKGHPDRHPNNSTGHCQARGEQQQEHSCDSPDHL